MFLTKLDTRDIVVTALAAAAVGYSLLSWYKIDERCKYAEQLDSLITKKISHQLLPVVYATRDIPARTIISGDMLELKNIEEMRLPANAADCTWAAIGRESKYKIKKGEPIFGAALGLGLQPRGTASIAESRKFNLFLGIAEVTPKTFSWEGHSVVITEAWLEHGWKGDMSVQDPACDYLCFTVTVDGKCPSFYDKLWLWFLPEDNEIGFCCEADFTGGSQSRGMRYYVMLPKEKLSASVRLRAATVHHDSVRPQGEAPTNQFLTIKLPSS